MNTDKLLYLAERACIAHTLLKHDCNRTHTANELGISRRTLLYKLADYGWCPKARMDDIQQAASTFPLLQPFIEASHSDSIEAREARRAQSRLAVTC